MPDLLARAVAEIRDRQPDVLAVTGDLIDTPFYGMNDADCLARTRQDLHLVREIIDPVGCPVLYLFGNHDEPGAFHEVFSDQNPDITIGGYRFVSFYDEEQTDHFAERLGPQRERFEHVLQDGNPAPQVHLQHYMVWPENNEGYPHSYREAADLHTCIVNSSKVKLSLSGHYHKGVDVFEDGGTWFATSRAFCEAPHPYRIYDLQEQTVAQKEYVLGAETLSRALFVEGIPLVKHATTDAGFRSALLSSLADGWSLIAIGDNGDLPDTSRESAWDALLGELSACGLEFETAARNAGPDTIVETYGTVCESLGLDPGSSRALVFDSTEKTSERLGMKTRSATTETAVRALAEVTAS